MKKQMEKQDNYANLSIIDKISYIIDIDITDNWISDSIIEAGLYMIHYPDNVDLTKYGHIRGWVVDIFNKIIIYASYGYTKKIIMDRFEFPENGKLTYQDTDGINHTLDKEKTKFKIGIEGFTIGVFMHNNVLYFVTHRRFILSKKSGKNIITLSKSRYGSSKPFVNILKQLKFFEMLNINDDNSNALYPNPEKGYSPYVHMFLITYRDILYVSKEVINQNEFGYCTYLGIKNIWNPETIDIDTNKIEYDTYSPSNVTHNITLAKSHSHFYYPEELTVDQVNAHLSKGYHPNVTNNGDNRLGLGEFVVATDYDTSWPINIIQIQSVAYSWRSSVKGDHPNSYYQLFTLANMTKIDTTIPSGLIEFKRRLPVLNRYKIESIRNVLEQGNAIIKWDQDKANDSMILNPEDKFYNIWACYIMSVPLHKQLDIVNMYEKYYNDKADLIDFIYSKYLDGKYENQKIDKVISNAQQRANSAYNNIIISMDYNNLVRNAIENIVNNSEGSYVYSLIKIMKFD